MTEPGRKYHINRKIIFIFSFITLLLLSTAYINHSNIRRYESSIEHIRDVSFEQLSLLNLIELNAGAKKVAVIYYIFSDDPQKKEYYRVKLDSLHKQNNIYYDAFQESITREEIFNKTQEVLSDRQVYFERLRRVVSEDFNLGVGNPFEFEENELEPAYEFYLNELQELSLLVIDVAKTNIDNTFAEIENARRISNILLITGMVFLIVMSITLVKIVKKLKKDYRLLASEGRDKEKAQEELGLLYKQLEQKVTERTEELERTNKELRNANLELSSLHSIIELSDNPIIISDLNDRITYWNKGAEKLYGCPKDEAIGQICRLYLERDFSEPYFQVKEKLLEAGDWYGEIRSINKVSNEEVFTMSNWKLFKDENNVPISILEIDHDITSRKEVEQEIKRFNNELKSINAAKDKMFSVISHDLRNPVASLLSSSEILKNNIEQLEKAEIKQFAEIIHRTTDKLLDQLNELVGWAKTQHQKVAFNPQNLKLCLEVNQALNLLMPGAKQKDLRLQNQVSENIHVMADRYMLKSILQNLISNSMKFTNQGGHILITAQLKDAMVEVQVMDTGIGMSDSQKQCLFENNNASDSKASSSGLGFLLIRDFVAQHNGALNVESEVNKGTTISFTLPKA